MAICCDCNHAGQLNCGVRSAVSPAVIEGSQVATISITRRTRRPTHAPRCADCLLGDKACGSACCNAVKEACYDFDRPAFAPFCCPQGRQGCGATCCAADEFCVRPALYGYTTDPYCESCAGQPSPGYPATDWCLRLPGNNALTGCCKYAPIRGGDRNGFWACPDVLHGNYREDGAVACNRVPDPN